MGWTHFRPTYMVGLAPIHSKKEEGIVEPSVDPTRPNQARLRPWAQVARRYIKVI